MNSNNLSLLQIIARNIKYCITFNLVLILGHVLMQIIHNTVYVYFLMVCILYTFKPFRNYRTHDQMHPTLYTYLHISIYNSLLTLYPTEMFITLGECYIHIPLIY